MSFEDAFTVEMEAISVLKNKVFPVAVPPKTDPPYLCYRKANKKIKKTLDGAMPKYEAMYEMYVLARTYTQIQTLCDAIEAKVLSFLHRSIGTGGPYIENVTLEYLGDNYELDPDMFRADLQLKVNY